MNSRAARPRTWIGLLALGSFACSLGDPSEDAPGGEVLIPDSRQWIVDSEIAGRTYQIQVSLPREYDVLTTAYQVVYLLDANGQFGMTTEIVRNLTYFDEDSPGLIVVGVGYPVGQFFDALGARGLDLTPNRDTVWEASETENLPEAGPYLTGGASEFLAFLSDELVPRVESEFRVDGSTRTLIGHSLGGLFALYAMLEAPALFQQYIIISPSMWWDCMDDSMICRQDAGAPDGWPLRREAMLRASGGSLTGRLFLTVGGEESPIMIEGSRRLAARLEERGYQDLDWTFEFVAEEWHMSIVPGAISTGLRWLHFGAP